MTDSWAPVPDTLDTNRSDQGHRFPGELWQIMIRIPGYRPLILPVLKPPTEHRFKIQQEILIPVPHSREIRNPDPLKPCWNPPPTIREPFPTPVAYPRTHSRTHPRSHPRPNPLPNRQSYRRSHPQTLMLPVGSSISHFSRNHPWVNPR